MTSRSLAACLCAALAVLVTAGSASAKPAPKPHTFEGTFPVASKLCAKADAGALPGKLAESVDQVKTACGTLRTDFAATLATYNTAVAPLKQQAKDAVAAAKTACTSADSAERRARPGAGGAGRPSAECRAARTEARATLRSIRAQVGALTKTYRTGVKAERAAFWKTIRGLKGGAAVPTDPAAGVPTPPPVTIPADSSVG